MECDRIEPKSLGIIPKLSNPSPKANPMQTPLQYEVEVGEQGQIQLQVPFSAGQKIILLVIDPQDNLKELVTASTSSLAFWDNAIDDEEWNHA
jgi:hypothetical protein